MNKQKLEELIKKSREAVARAKISEAEIAANKGPATLWDLYCLPNMPENYFGWFAIIGEHPDNEGDLENPKDDDTFLVVPVDDCTILVGGCDVVGQSKHFGKLVARCGYSMWVNRRDIDNLHGKSVAEVGRSEILPEFAKDCRLRIAALVRGNIHEVEDDCNPDYHEWMDVVLAAVQHVEQVRETG